MKKLIYTALLAFAFALPLTAITKTADADPWYIVEKGTGPGADGKVDIRSRAHGEGRVVCAVPKGQVFHRNHEKNWSRWIHAQWTFNNPLHGNRPRLESHYRDAFGKWCPLWDRRGWIDKSDPDLKVIQIRNRQHTIVPVPNTWTQRIVSTGRWGNDVPVFRDQGSFFNARNNGKIENVVCRLKKGHHVSFTPFKDWGVGLVIRDNCRGWIDKGVVQ